jgi:hypothetical protein
VFIRGSRFLSLIFPSAVYHGPVLLPPLLGNEPLIWFCGSCKRKLEHVQTCLSAWGCLTQHPSDTLGPFWEINCHTLYSKPSLIRIEICEKLKMLFTLEYALLKCTRHSGRLMSHLSVQTTIWQFLDACIIAFKNKHDSLNLLSMYKCIVFYNF